MSTEIIGGVLGIACLGLVCIGTFLLVPERELTVRERIAIHTIFWSFIIYAIWMINSLIKSPAHEKYFYITIAILLGLLISLLSEFKSKQPPLNITDARLKKLIDHTWNRLPTHVKRDLQNTVMNITEVAAWSDFDKESFKTMTRNPAKWYPLLPLPARGLIHISNSDCKDLQDAVIVGAIVYEFGLAYQSSRTPFEIEKINVSGETLPLKWNFKKEIDAIIKYREQKGKAA